MGSARTRLLTYQSTTKYGTFGSAIAIDWGLALHLSKRVHHFCLGERGGVLSVPCRAVGETRQRFGATTLRPILSRERRWENLSDGPLIIDIEIVIMITKEQQRKLKNGYATERA